jgi:hypothetical protein
VLDETVIATFIGVLLAESGFVNKLEAEEGSTDTEHTGIMLIPYVISTPIAVPLLKFTETSGIITKH